MTLHSAAKSFLGAWDDAPSASVKGLIEALDGPLEALRSALAAQPPGAVTVEWTLDERVGVVAIYKGPHRTCLSGIATDPACVFVADGSWISGDDLPVGGHWEIDPADVDRARRCHAALTLLAERPQHPGAPGGVTVEQLALALYVAWHAESTPTPSVATWNDENISHRRHWTRAAQVALSLLAERNDGTGGGIRGASGDGSPVRPAATVPPGPTTRAVACVDKEAVRRILDGDFAHGYWEPGTSDRLDDQMKALDALPLLAERPQAWRDEGELAEAFRGVTVRIDGEGAFTERHYGKLLESSAGDLARVAMSRPVGQGTDTTRCPTCFGIVHDGDCPAAKGVR